jgi:FkbM family methyltransferase
MKVIEKLKLWSRASRYRYKLDKGGIAFIISAVKPGQTVMDIGAHKGGYLYYFQKLTGTKGKVFAFEPQKLLFTYLNTLAEIMGWRNVVVENVAISDVNGSAILVIPAKRTGIFSSPGASIVKEMKTSGYFIREEVKTITLDSWCRKMNIEPDFLKIDVEGNELQVLSGGIETIKRCLPHFHIEIEERHAGREKLEGTFRFFYELGYTGKFIHGSVLQPLDTFNLNEHQNIKDRVNYCNNFIFSHPMKPL